MSFHDYVDYLKDAADAAEDKERWDRENALLVEEYTQEIERLRIALGKIKSVARNPTTNERLVACYSIASSALGR